MTSHARAAVALTNLGQLALRQGHIEQADGYLADALILFRATGEPAGEAHTLCNLGELRLQPSDSAKRCPSTPIWPCPTRTK